MDSSGLEEENNHFPHSWLALLMAGLYAHCSLCSAMCIAAVASSPLVAIAIFHSRLASGGQMPAPVWGASDQRWKPRPSELTDITNAAGGAGIGAFELTVPIGVPKVRTGE